MLNPASFDFRRNYFIDGMNARSFISLFALFLSLTFNEPGRFQSTADKSQILDEPPLQVKHFFSLIRTFIIKHCIP